MQQTGEAGVWSLRMASAFGPAFISAWKHNNHCPGKDRINYITNNIFNYFSIFEKWGPKNVQFFHENGIRVEFCVGDEHVDFVDLNDPAYRKRLVDFIRTVIFKVILWKIMRFRRWMRVALMEQYSMQRDQSLTKRLKKHTERFLQLICFVLERWANLNRTKQSR